MGSKQITVTVDGKILEQFDVLAKKLGSSRSSLINILLTQCVRQQGLPTITLKPQSKSGEYEIPIPDNSSILR